MKFKKIVSWVWILAMLGSATFTFYLGIKDLIDSPTSNIDNLNLSKVKFDDLEWRSFIDSNAQIDQNAFISSFLRKASSQKNIEEIQFEFDDRKVVVTISNYTRLYKWFYELQ